MRLNQFLASSTGISRRSADAAIAAGRVIVNGQAGIIGQQVEPEADTIELDGQTVQAGIKTTILFHKPTGAVTSRNGQGSRTIYDSLPNQFQSLKPIGRLDKDSSGLLILTSDGHLANKLIHPSQGKTKRYLVTLDRPLSPEAGKGLIAGVRLAEGMSQVKVTDQDGKKLRVELATGWNRQIRRTFEAIGYEVTGLKRLAIGNFELAELPVGQWRELTPEELSWLD